MNKVFPFFPISAIQSLSRSPENCRDLKPIYLPEKEQGLVLSIKFSEKFLRILTKFSDFWKFPRFFENVFLSKFLRIFQASCTKIFRFFCQKIGPINKFSEKILRIWIFQFSRNNLTNFLTNFGAASWTKFRVSFIGYFDMSTFQKSKNLVEILRIFFDNFIDRTKPWAFTHYKYNL